jgi:HK97 gp10 family phage protein
MAGFLIDASAAIALAVELERTKTLILFEVRRATNAAGKAMQSSARQNAKSRSMPGLSRSIYTKTKQLAGGTEITIEAKSPFGYIREFGAGRSGPHPFMLPALESNLGSWEDAMAAAAAKVL